MTRSRVVSVTCVIMIGVFTAGCAVPEEKLVDSARSGMARLRESGASSWAPVEVACAEQGLTAAQKELAHQAARLAPLRRYTRSDELFRGVLEDIEVARHAAVEAERLAREESREALDAAVSAVRRARTAMMLAPVSRVHTSAYEKLDSGLIRAESFIDEAREFFQQRRYREVTSRSERVLSLIASRVRGVRRGRGV